MNRKKVLWIVFFAVVSGLFLSGCQNHGKKGNNTDACISQVTPSHESTRYDDMDFLSETEREQLHISELGGIYTIRFYDEILDDVFSIYVSVPEEIESKETYPVVYLLEEYNTEINSMDSFKTMTAAQGQTVKKIFVSINFPEQMTESDIVGKEEAFYQMLTDKIMPFIKKIYNGDLSSSTLCAEGGIASYISEYGIFDDGFKFKNYIIVSPEYNYTTYQEDIFVKEEEYAEREKELSASLYFYTGEDVNETAYVKRTKNLVSIAKKRNFKHCNIAYEEISGYGAKTVWYMALQNGLSVIFHEKIKLQEDLLSSESSSISNTSSWKYTSMGAAVNGTILEDDCSTYQEEADDTYHIQVFYNNGYSLANSQKIIILPYTDLDSDEIGEILQGQNSSGRILVVKIEGSGEKSESRDMRNEPEVFLNFLVNQVLIHLEKAMELNCTETVLAGEHLEGYFTLYAMFHWDTLCQKAITDYIAWYPDFNNATDKKTIEDFQQFFEDRRKNSTKATLSICLEKSSKEKIIVHYQKLFQEMEESNQLFSVSCQEIKEEENSFKMQLMQMIQN